MRALSTNFKGIIISMKQKKNIFGAVAALTVGGIVCAGLFGAPVAAVANDHKDSTHEDGEHKDSHDGKGGDHKCDDGHDCDGHKH